MLSSKIAQSRASPYPAVASCSYSYCITPRRLPYAARYRSSDAPHFTKVARPEVCSTIHRNIAKFPILPAIDIPCTQCCIQAPTAPSWLCFSHIFCMRSKRPDSTNFSRTMAAWSESSNRPAANLRSITSGLDAHFPYRSLRPICQGAAIPPRDPPLHCSEGILLPWPKCQHTRLEMCCRRET